MNRKKKIFCVLSVMGLTIGTLLMLQVTSISAAGLTEIEELGKQLFFDTNLSQPVGQSCASCHDPNAGFVDPRRHLPVSEGALAGRFVTRNTPSAGYATFIPAFTRGNGGGGGGGGNNQGPRGGQFWDGREDTLADQAENPFLGADEMNNPNRETVVNKVAASSYAQMFRDVFGNNAFNNVDTAYRNIAVAIAAFEESSEVNPFSSKFDAVQRGQAQFTQQEDRGRRLFFGRARCDECHDSPGNNNTQIFSDFRYRNTGVPENTEFPYNILGGNNDLGLAEVSGIQRDRGRFKTPHLRNIALTAPYMHNGVFKTLKEVVHFYNARDVAGEFPGPAVNQNVEQRDLGDLGLSDDEEDAIVAFLLTLTDGFNQ